MVFELRNRAYSDNDISEIAGKTIPLHPTARYKRFPNLWKKTRQVSGYVPRPTTCATKENELFPCCLSCLRANPGALKELLARRSANVGWLSADWWWDFGWVLPEEFVSFGIGITPPDMPVETDRIFVFDLNSRRSYIEYTLEEHASFGANQHEARIKIVEFIGNVDFPGQIIGTKNGQIFIGIPRTTLFGKGIEIFEQYVFEAIEMAFPLSILLDGVDFVQQGDKILLNGVTI